MFIMLDIIEKQFNVSYETNCAEKHLVLSLNQEAEIINYQVEIIGSNPINSILPINIIRKDDRLSLYYSIASKQSIAEFLKKKKLKVNEVLYILKNITKSLLNSRNYFLSESGFVLEEEYMYIDPVSLKVSLVYIPIESDIDFISNFKGFIENLIVNSVNMHENDKAKLIQMILDNIKESSFDIIGFDKLLTELRNQAVNSYSELGEEPVETMVNMSERSKVNILPSIKQESGGFFLKKFLFKGKES